MATTLYGIPNCDTVKKARAWLAEHDMTVTFHDYKKAGVDPAALDAWIAKVGWESLLNRAGTTFRKLPDTDRADIDAAKARALMIAHPSLIKRPVLVDGDRIEVGFKPERYAERFAPSTTVVDALCLRLAISTDDDVDLR